MKIVILAFAMMAFSAAAGVDEKIRPAGGNLCSSESAAGCAMFPIGQQCVKDGKFGSCTATGRTDRSDHPICGCSTFN